MRNIGKAANAALSSLPKTGPSHRTGSDPVVPAVTSAVPAVMNQPHPPRAFVRFVGGAFAGSSGQGCLG